MNGEQNRNNVIVISDDEDSETLDPVNLIIIDDSDEEDLLLNIPWSNSCSSNDAGKLLNITSAVPENERKRKLADNETTSNKTQNRKRAKHGRSNFEQHEVREETTVSSPYWTRSCSILSQEKEDVAVLRTSLDEEFQPCASESSCSNNPGTSAGEKPLQRLVIWNDGDTSSGFLTTTHQSQGGNLNGRDSTGAKDIFTCPICRCIAFSGKKSRRQFHSHFRFAHVSQYYECEKCGVEFQKKKAVLKHFKSCGHHVKCLLCMSDEVFIPFGMLNQHIKQVHMTGYQGVKELPKVCPFLDCSMKLSQSEHFYNHLTKHYHSLHRPPFTLVRKLACTKCERKGLTLCSALVHYITDHGIVPTGKAMQILREDLGGVLPNEKKKRRRRKKASQRLRQQKNGQVILPTDGEETRSEGTTLNLNHSSLRKGEDPAAENKQTFTMDTLEKIDTISQDPRLSRSSILPHYLAMARSLTKEGKFLSFTKAKDRSVIWSADDKETASTRTASNTKQPCNSNKGEKSIEKNNQTSESTSDRVSGCSSKMNTPCKTGANTQGPQMSSGTVLQDNQTQATKGEKALQFVTVKEPMNQTITSIWYTDTKEIAHTDTASSIQQPCNSRKGKEPVVKNKLALQGSSASEMETTVKTNETTQVLVLPCGTMKDLAKFSHIIFIDLDNWGKLFTLPYSLPNNVFVWGFCGGNYASTIDKSPQCQKLVQEKRFFMHPKCGKSKNAADFALCVQAARLDLQLPPGIPFTVLSGDKGFTELRNQLSSSARQIHLIDPHSKEPEILTAILNSIGDV